MAREDTDSRRLWKPSQVRGSRSRTAPRARSNGQGRARLLWREASGARDVWSPRCLECETSGARGEAAVRRGEALSKSKGAQVGGRMRDTHETRTAARA